MPRRPAANEIVKTEEAIRKIHLSPVEPPRPLSPEALRFFIFLSSEKKPSQWSYSDLVTLCDLAELQVTFEVEKQLLKEEGTIVVSRLGADIKNPRLHVVSVIRKELMALARFLTISPEQNERPARATAREVKTALTEADDDDLLA